MARTKFERNLESDCPQCGNKYRLQFSCRIEEVAFCPFCGEDMFISSPEEEAGEPDDDFGETVEEYDDDDTDDEDDIQW